MTGDTREAVKSLHQIGEDLEQLLDNADLEGSMAKTDDRDRDRCFERERRGRCFEPGRRASPGGRGAG